MIQAINDSYSQGYELAQSEFCKLSEYPQSSKDWVDFFVNSTKEYSDVYFCSGVASFITEKEAASLDMRTFNKELGQLANVVRQYLHDSRMIDRLLNGVVEIPVELRFVNCPNSLLNVRISCDATSFSVIKAATPLQKYTSEFSFVELIKKSTQSLLD